MKDPAIAPSPMAGSMTIPSEPLTHHPAITTQRTLFLVCFGNELFFVTLYLNHFYTTPLFTSSSIASGNPIASALLSFVSNNTKSSTFLGRLLWHPKAGEYLYHWTNSTSTGITWPQILLILTGPVCLLKNVINVVQFWKASKIVSRKRNDGQLEGSFLR